MANDTRNGMNFVFFAVIGTIAFIAIVGTGLWMQTVLPGSSPDNYYSTGFDFYSGKRVRLVDSGGTFDMNAVVSAIEKGGCVSCHTIPNIPGAEGQIGPNLSQIGAAAATREEGTTAEEYIRESIQNPNAFIAPECPAGPCPAGVMPQIELTEDELDSIVNYLSALGQSEVASTEH